MAKPLFDPVSFMNEPVAENATKRDTRPPGEGIGQVIELKWDSGTSGPQSKRPGEPWYRMTAVIETEDPAYLALRPHGGGPKETFFYGIMYEADDTGRPKTGHNVNVQLGKFREACNANGKPFAACVGAFVRFAVENKPHYKNPEDVVDEISAVTKA